MAPSPVRRSCCKLSGESRIRVFEMMGLVHHEQRRSPASLSQQVLPQRLLDLPKSLAGGIQSFGDARIASAGPNRHLLECLRQGSKVNPTESSCY